MSYIVCAVLSDPPVLSLARLLSALHSTEITFKIDILLALTPAISLSWQPQSSKSVNELMMAICQYLDEIITSSANIFLDADDMSAAVNETFWDVVAGFILAVAENPSVDKLFRFALASDEQQTFQNSLVQFIAHLRIANETLGDNLATATQKFMSDTNSQTVLPVEIKNEPQKASSGKMTWMESMVTRHLKFGYSEFSEKIQDVFNEQTSEAAIANLVSASFECLTKCALAQDQARVFLWKTFIMNRLPLIFQQYLISVPSSTFEYALRRPLLSIDDDALAIINSRPANEIDLIFAVPSVPYDVRLEFLKSLVQVGLIDYAAADRVLGGIIADSGDVAEPIAVNASDLMTTLTSSYDTESAVKQFVADIENLGCLGQSVAVDVIAELLSVWPGQKETYKLKILTQEIAMNTTVMNIILVYKDPYELLRPLIVCLDTWSYEDESNFQENYAEFGMTLLFVCSFYFHFDLDLKKMGTFGENSFCFKYLTASGTAHPIEALGQESLDILGGWIISLFDTNGISDDMMRSCSPMDYALLVPTILQQSVAACNRNSMDIETLKGGIEYFLHPFLLFSAVGALHWLAHDLWTLHDLDITLQILQALVNPQFLSDESRPIHKIVLQVSSLPVYNIIHNILRSILHVSDSINLNGIMDTLTPYLQFRKGL
ncbi:mediator complex subunit Med5-domain-containing protein [Lipomyces arxii]|uniref:mediator complex subunit Med5-domain-containing protein n=1 Tax=Lipomyces arxii TaxID=56418 RepID=UPI0034CE6291